jgi:methylmalonyl-CoA carboxyltransferase 12S subunit
MKKPSAARTDPAEALNALRQELASLAARVAALEASLRAPHPSPLPLGEGTKASSTPAPEPLSEELLLAISAALAAYFGKKPHIRQIRLLGTTAWAQQGRASIQASRAQVLQHR